MKRIIFIILLLSITIFTCIYVFADNRTYAASKITSGISNIGFNSLYFGFFIIIAVSFFVGYFSNKK